MRIFFIAYSHVKIAAGGEQQIASEMIRAVREHGHEAEMIIGLEAADAAPFVKTGAKLSEASWEPRVCLFTPDDYDDETLSCRDARALAALRQRVREFRPDVIHVHHYYRLGMETLVACRLAAPDAVITITFHEMIAICAANGQMVKRHSRAICLDPTPAACAECGPFGPEHYAL